MAGLIAYHSSAKENLYSNPKNRLGTASRNISAAALQKLRVLIYYVELRL